MLFAANLLDRQTMYLGLGTYKLLSFERIGPVVLTALQRQVALQICSADRQWYIRLYKNGSIKHFYIAAGSTMAHLRLVHALSWLLRSATIRRNAVCC